MKKSAILMGIFLFLFAGCGGGGGEKPEAQNMKPEVVATTTMIADMVRAIAGSDLEVTGLIAPGLDPHTYSPGAKSLGKLRNADLILYNGMHLEGKLTETFEKQKGKSLAITDLLPKEKLISAEAIDEDYGDPHIWGDPALWGLAIPGVVEKLSELLPEKKTEFEARGKVYSEEVKALDAWAKRRMAEVKPEDRILITSHDAFNYFGRAYIIEVYGIQGISTVDEPSGAAVLEAIDLIKEKGVKAVFPESSVPKAVIERISKDSGAKVGETLFSDSCGKLGDKRTLHGETYDVGSYIGMMKHNINAIVDALK